MDKYIEKQLRIFAKDSKGHRAVLTFKTKETWVALDIADVRAMKKFDPYYIDEIFYGDDNGTLRGWVKMGDIMKIRKSK